MGEHLAGAETGAAGAAPRLELTTVTTDAATFHQGTEVDVVEGLQPATTYEHRGITFTALPRPAGTLRCRIATVNDVHFGEFEAGKIDDSGRGPIQRVAPGDPPYPEVMNRAAVGELLASERVDGPFAAVIAKGDLTADGQPAEFAAFEDCYRTPFGTRLHAVRGNHDAYHGQHDYAGDEWIELAGINIALLDTTIPGVDGGQVTADQLDWLDAHAAESTDPVIVMGHHPQNLGAPGDDPNFGLTPEASAAFSAALARRDALIAYTAGHTHRHRVQIADGGVPTIEVGCVKDFPGTWAEYRVYDGGVLQIVHRISAPDALRWSEQCRGLYADFGVDYAEYSLGRLDDRCFQITLRA